jgi:hypothetical protein
MYKDEDYDLHSQLYLKVGILAACGRHVHDFAMILRWWISSNKTSLIPRGGSRICG